MGTNDGLLNDYRVLDLCNSECLICGKLLADFGADVIKIEKPGGDAFRNIGPFYHDIPDPEKSIPWFAYNTGKRSISLDIETQDGQEIFKRLAKTIDIIVESLPPGYMEKWGLGYKDLNKINPALIMTSITPFGQSGPYRDYHAPDLVLMAMSGVQYLYGNPDRPPLRVSYPQAYLHAGADAFAGTLIALYHRELTGEGQYVDVSVQESTMLAMFNALPFWDMNKINQKRLGSLRGGLTLAGIKLNQTWQCKDGYVTFMLMGARAGAKTNRALVEWMDSEGMSDDLLNSMDWSTYDFGTTTQEFHDRVHEPIAKFFLTHTQQELFQGAIERDIMLYPANNVEAIVNDPQLGARDFWQELEHPELSTTIRYPGAVMKASDIELSPKRRAPLIGEHNLDIYEGELGLSREEILILKQANVI